MRLLVHLLKADMRRFRGFIAIWIALVAAGVVLYALSPTLAGDTPLFTAVQTIAGLLWLARQLLRVILIALIVQAHPTVGSTAFWMTRPVSPKLLFASKVLLVFGLTVGLPAAGDLLMGLAYRVPAPDIALAVLQTAFVSGAWTAVLMTIAVPTRNLTQFAAVCGVAILCAAVGPIVLVAMHPQGPPGRSGVASDPLIPVVAGVLLVFFLAAAWLVQYVRRNRRESFPVVVAGVCLAIGFGTMTEPPLLARQVEPPPSWARAATLRLPPVPPDIYTGTEIVTWGIEGGRTSFAVARARVVLPELPAGWLATALLRGATVVAKGKTFTCGTPPYQASASLLSRETGHNRHATEVALGEALGVPDVLHFPSHGTDTAMLFFVPYADIDPVDRVHGSYRGSFRLGLMRLEAVASLPLSGGATFQDGADRVTIGAVRLDDELVSIRLERSSVPTILPNRRPRYDFYLRNRAQGQALGGGIRQAHGTYSWVPGVSALADLTDASPGVNRWAEFLTFRGSGSLAKPGALTREWLDGAELVVVRTTNAGEVERELAVDDFRWRPPSKQ